MSIHKKVVLVLLFLLLLISICPAQSPWVRTKGSLYTQFSFNMIAAYSDLYLKNENSQNTARELTDMTLQAWYEYGAAENSMLLVVVPLKRLEAGKQVEASGSEITTQEGTLLAAGNIQLGWRQTISQRFFRVSGQLLLELPTAAYKAGSGLRSGYDCWGVRPSLSIGKGYSSGYFFSYIATTLRSNNYSSLFNAGVEAGYRFFDTFWLAAVIDGLKSFKNGSRKISAANLETGLYVNNQEHMAWGLKCFGDIISNKFGYSAAYFGAFSGNYVAKSPSVNIGFFYIFR